MRFQVQSIFNYAVSTCGIGGRTGASGGPTQPDRCLMPLGSASPRSPPASTVPVLLFCLVSNMDWAAGWRHACSNRAADDRPRPDQARSRHGHAYGLTDAGERDAGSKESSLLERGCVLRGGTRARKGSYRLFPAVRSGLSYVRSARDRPVPGAAAGGRSPTLMSPARPLLADSGRLGQTGALRFSPRSISM